MSRRFLFSSSVLSIRRTRTPLSLSRFPLPSSSSPSLTASCRLFADMPTDVRTPRTPPLPVASSSSLAERDEQSPWREVKDPQGSALTYWWNEETNETTALGAPRPSHWVEVSDPNGSGLTYWWDKESNVTTALGSPRPHGSVVPGQQQMLQPRPVSFGSAMKQMVALGFGVSIAMIMVRALIG